MKGDFSRSTFDRKKHYHNVLLQQGRPLLDADWNEHIDIEAHLRQTRALDMIGLSGAPVEGGGFQIDVNGDDLTISPGRIYVDGILCENHNDVPVLFSDQPDLREEQLPSEPGTYLAYLDVWERHVTPLEDERLREVALEGPDSATRARVVWQVKLQPYDGELADKTSISCADFKPWPPNVPQTTGAMAARATSDATPDNLLYRVEIHTGGGLGIATFKWSRENGSVVGRIEDIDIANNIIKVSLVGRLPETAFAPGQWVELSDEKRALRGQPGTFVRLADVQGNELKVVAWPSDFSLDESSLCTARRWDSPGGSVALARKQDNGSPLSLTVPFALENGIQVTFSEGEYRSGDYWVFPARAISRDIEWPHEGNTPLSQPPHGVQHHYCRLALVIIKDGSLSMKEDCRELFAPLTGQRSGSGVSRDVHQPAHGFKIGQAIYYDYDLLKKRGQYKLARSDGETTTGMFLVSAVKDTSHFTLLQAGYLTGLEKLELDEKDKNGKKTGLTPGEYYYVSAAQPGMLTSVEPLGISNPILFADSLDGGFVLPYRPSESSQEFLKEYIDDLLVGSVTAFAMQTPPEGWLECNGQMISRVKYTRLFEKIGTTFGAGNGPESFNVPDLRSEFIRGWANKRVLSPEVPNETNRVFGSWQVDVMHNHGHNVSGGTTENWPGAVNQIFDHYAYAQYSAPGWRTYFYSAGSAPHAHSFNVNSASAAIDVGTGTPRTGMETRPRNVAMLYCIKF